MRDLRIKDKQDKIKINSIKIINEEQIIEETAKNNNKRIDIISRSDSEDIAIKINQSFPYDENKIKEVEVREISINKKKSKKKLDSTKICTLCGYIYIEKKIGNKKTCVCYYYTNKCKWLREKLIRFDVIAPLITELYCQISIVGYNSILTEKLLNVYPYSKIMKFYGAFFVLSLFVPVFVVYDINKKIKKKEKHTSGDFFSMTGILMLGFIFFSFISSLYYLNDDNLERERWNNIVIGAFIYFKIIDLVILSFFDIFDNSDIFNASLAITIEKLIWMIIEAIIDGFNVKKKTLVIIQIIPPSILFLFNIAACIVYVCEKYKDKNKKKQKIIKKKKNNKKSKK